MQEKLIKNYLDEQKWQQVEEREARRDDEEVEVELDKF